MAERRKLDDLLGSIVSRAELAIELGMSEAALIAKMSEMSGVTYLRIGRTVAFASDDVAFIRASLVKSARSPAYLADASASVAYDVPEVGLSPYWKTHFLRAKRGATVRGLAFKLDIPQMRALIARAGGRCEVSGIPFDEGRQSHSTWKPFAPSLDRILSSASYDMENCRLVCCAVNIAMGNWGEDVLWTIALAMAARGRPTEDCADG